jgi:hypothetical protein
VKVGASGFPAEETAPSARAGIRIGQADFHQGGFNLPAQRITQLS